MKTSPQIRRFAYHSLFTLMLVLLSLAHPPAATAQEETLVRCRLERTQILVGEQTTLFIEVQNVTNLYGYQLDLYFDSDVVQLSGAKQDDLEGMILGTFVSPDFVVNNEIDNAFGVVFLALTQISPSPARSGSGELARATVRGIDSGVSEFSFESLILADDQGNEIGRRIQGCNLTVLEPGQPTTTPTATTTPPTSTPTPTDTPTPTSTTPPIGTPPPPTRTLSPTITLTPTITPSPTFTPQTPTLTPTQTPVPFLTALASVLPTIVAGYTPTPSPTNLPSPSPAFTPTSLPPTPTVEPSQRQAAALQTGLWVALGAVLFAALILLFSLAWQLRRGR
jgi:hypothetical protein